MKQFISWAIIKRLTESESILLRRGIEAHFRARLQPYYLAPLAPAAPHFIFLETLSPLGGFFSNLAGVCSKLGEFFRIYCSDISTNQRGHMTKKSFFRWVSLPG